MHSPELEKVRAFCHDGMADLVKAAEVRTRSGAGELLIHLKEAGMKAAAMERLPQGRADIDGMAVYEPSLNDIFVHTAGDENEEGGVA